jgi:hypothetical protein
MDFLAARRGGDEVGAVGATGAFEPFLLVCFVFETASPATERPERPERVVARQHVSVFPICQIASASASPSPQPTQERRSVCLVYHVWAEAVRRMPEGIV